MEIIQFDVSGKFAHFRKYYANNTAMTYSIPPRTTVMGMLAAILGLPKDSYYEALASDKIRIGVAVKTPIKKAFHRINLLSIKSKGDVRKSFESDFRGMNGRIQTPFEIVSGPNVQTDEVGYRVFVSSFEAGRLLFEELKTCLEQNKTHFQVALGAAQFLASVNNYYLFKTAKEFSSPNDWVDFSSAIISDTVLALDFQREGLQYFVEEELLPADFKANFDRELNKMNRVLFTTGDMPLRAKSAGRCFELQKGTERQIIQFLE